uniref:Uncharacterized protein n=1 Tax=Steinernema glaseri TaxID=37863 RepID=A0A1I7YLA8_9BILA
MFRKPPMTQEFQDRTYFTISLPERTPSTLGIGFMPDHAKHTNGPLPAISVHLKYNALTPSDAVSSHKIRNQM